jgi:hypothetical protein
VLAASPIASIQSNSVTFPTITVGAPSSGLSTTLTNTGNAALQVTGVTIGGTDAADFRLGTGNTCAPGTLAVGASCQLEVAFVPQSAGTKTAVVTISHNATGGSTVVAVSGNAATATSTGTTGGTSGTSSALAPSNVGGGGSTSPWQLLAIGSALLLAPMLRRRPARR